MANQWALSDENRAILLAETEKLVAQIREKRHEAKPVKRAIGDLIVLCHEAELGRQAGIFAIVMTLLQRRQEDRLLAMLIRLDQDTKPELDSQGN